MEDEEVMEDDMHINAKERVRSSGKVRQVCPKSTDAEEVGEGDSKRRGKSHEHSILLCCIH